MNWPALFLSGGSLKLNLPLSPFLPFLAIDLLAC